MFSALWYVSRRPIWVSRKSHISTTKHTNTVRTTKHTNTVRTRSTRNSPESAFLEHNKLLWHGVELFDRLLCCVGAKHSTDAIFDEFRAGSLTRFGGGALNEGPSLLDGGDVAGTPWPFFFGPPVVQIVCAPLLSDVGGVGGCLVLLPQEGFVAEFSSDEADEDGEDLLEVPCSGDLADDKNWSKEAEPTQGAVAVDSGGVCITTTGFDIGAGLCPVNVIFAICASLKLDDCAVRPDDVTPKGRRLGDGEVVVRLALISIDCFDAWAFVTVKRFPSLRFEPLADGVDADGSVFFGLEEL